MIVELSNDILYLSPENTSETNDIYELYISAEVDVLDLDQRNIKETLISEIK